MVGKFRKWVPKPPGPWGVIPSGAKGAGREGGRPAGKPVTACRRLSPGFRRAGGWLCPMNQWAGTELGAPGWVGPTHMASSQSPESTPHALVCWSIPPAPPPPPGHQPSMGPELCCRTIPHVCLGLTWRQFPPQTMTEACQLRRQAWLWQPRNLASTECHFVFVFLIPVNRTCSNRERHACPD